MRSPRLLALVVLGAILVPPLASAAPTITEVGGFTANRGPTRIAAGPDGNLWLTQSTGTGGIARVSAAGAVSEFTTGLTASSEPTDIAAGPDGNLWFTGQANPGRIGRITPAGVITEFTAGLTTNADPVGIAAGPDGNLWFTAKQNPARIGRITPAGVISEFVLPTSSSQPEAITAGPDGNLWFTAHSPSRIGRITPAGVITEFTAGLSGTSDPAGITAGPDGNLWFAAQRNPGRIGRITPAGVITEFSAGLTTNAEPTDIAAGPDGNLWFTMAANPGRIGRITPAGVITEFTTGLTSNAEPTGIAAGPDGRMWFTEYADPGRIGAITVGPAVSASAVQTTGSDAATVQASIAPNAEDTTYSIEWGTTSSYGQQTAGQLTPAAGGTQVRSVTLSGLSPATTYHFRFVATNATTTATGPDMTFTTAAAPAPPPGSPLDPGNPLDPGAPLTPPDPLAPATPAPAPPPIVGRRVGVEPGRGVVRVKERGTNRYVPLAEGEGLPMGSVVDTRRGRVELTSALPNGRTQTAVFWGGIFTVRQTRSGLVRLRLPKATGCTRAPAVSSGHSEDARRSKSKPRKRPRKRRPALWGKDKRGRYRTEGSNSVATVRGTKWLVVNRCDGTLTRVREGAVVVRDLKRKRTVLVRAGRSYLARSRR